MAPSFSAENGGTLSEAVPKLKADRRMPEHLAE
jgi:hypothetical protein